MSAIADTAGLAAFCARAAGFPFVAIDTEFVRETTYWPQLCLVQLASPEEAWAIDPLADGIDLAPLFDLLDDDGTLKVFHSARQDLEIFFHLTGRVPRPIFDTQVAAMVCGYGESAGYQRLVRSLTGASVDKGMQYADWRKRPLDERRIAYALSDVTHLRGVYAALSRRLDADGREEWLSEEMDVLSDPATYRPDPENAWKRLKARSRDPQKLAMLRDLAAWRDVAAERENLVRNRVLRDESVAEIAARAPRSVDEMASLRHLSRDRSWRRRADEILHVLDRVRASDPSSWPEPPRDGACRSGKGAAELLKTLLRIACERHGVAPKLVASAADVEALAARDDADVPALRGWRRKIFGEDALRLKHGEAALVMRGAQVELIDAPASRR